MAENVSDAEAHALDILRDGKPHKTWGRKTDPDAQGWNREEVGILNANVASRLQRRGLVHYARCGCCGASLGVQIGAAP